MPAGVSPGKTCFENIDAEVQLRDGSWVWCQVIGQRKARSLRGRGRGRLGYAP